MLPRKSLRALATCVATGVALALLEASDLDVDVDVAEIHRQQSPFAVPASKRGKADASVTVLDL